MAERVPIPWGWVGFFTALVVLTLLAALGLLRMMQQTAEQEGELDSTPVWRVMVHGEVHLLDEAAMQEFLGKLETGTSVRFQQLRTETDRFIEQEVERAFRPVYAAIPAYIDWYYSLPGEYLRLGHALGGDVADYMADKLKELLFRQSGAEGRLEALPQRLQQGVSDRLRRAGEAIVVDAAREMEAGGGRTVAEMRWELAGELPVDQLAEEALMPTGELARRQLVSLGTGLGAGALVAKGGGVLLVKKAVAGVAGSSGFKAAAALLGKVAAKSALKGGSALAGAGGGALLCAPGGPLALVCGALAGAATWLATDAALLELEEWLHREAFEREMAQAVRAEQRALERALKRLYDSWLKGRMEAFLQSVARKRVEPAPYRPLQELQRKRLNDDGAGAAPAAAPGPPSAPR